MFNLFKDLNINPNKIRIDTLLYYYTPTNGTPIVFTCTELEDAFSDYLIWNLKKSYTIKPVQKGVYELDKVNSNDTELRYCLLKDQVSCEIIYIEKEKLLNKINEGHIIPT